jgi:hypothetical protein
MGALPSHSTATLTTTPLQSARLAPDADERDRPPRGCEQRASSTVRFDSESTVARIWPRLVLTTPGGC